MKWYFIMVGMAFVAMFLGMGYSMAAKDKAKADIITACYKAGQPNCDKVWEK